MKFYGNHHWISILLTKAIDEKGKQLSANYLPMLLQLRSVYSNQDLQNEVKMIDKAIDQVGAQCRKNDQVQKLKKAYR